MKCWRLEIKGKGTGGEERWSPCFDFGNNKLVPFQAIAEGSNRQNYPNHQLRIVPTDPISVEAQRLNYLPERRIKVRCIADTEGGSYEEDFQLEGIYDAAPLYISQPKRVII
jgi:hypothetical protein